MIACENCKYYKSSSELHPEWKSERGWCNRYPPVYMSNVSEWMFVRAFSMDWCGEFKKGKGKK